MFHYRLIRTDGKDFGEATYTDQIVAGGVIHFGTAQFHVLRVVESNDDPTRGRCGPRG